MKILVIVPTHDRMEFLDAALDSLAAQTRPADEIVVIGNVRPDARHLVNGRVTYIYSDASLATRLNTVIAASDCDAFILLCDDDLLLPTYIQVYAAAMEESRADIVATENVLVTALYSKAIWAQAGGYCDIGFFDWDFRWSCLEAGAVAVSLRDHLFVYVQHPAQLAQHTRWHADGTWATWDAAIRVKHPHAGRP